MEKKKQAKPVIRQTVYLPPEVHKEIRKLAYTNSISQQTLLREGVDLMLKKRTGKSWSDISA